MAKNAKFLKFKCGFLAEIGRYLAEKWPIESGLPKILAKIFFITKSKKFVILSRKVDPPPPLFAKNEGGVSSVIYDLSQISFKLIKKTCNFSLFNFCDLRSFTTIISIAGLCFFCGWFFVITICIILCGAFPFTNKCSITTWFRTFWPTANDPCSKEKYYKTLFFSALPKTSNTINHNIIVKSNDPLPSHFVWKVIIFYIRQLTVR